jgi:hypothetical protein
MIEAQGFVDGDVNKYKAKAEFEKSG